MEEKKANIELSHPEGQTNTPFPETETSLLGFRGLLALQIIVYLIFDIFFPAAIANSSTTTGPKWQLIIRKTISVFLWNPSLICATLIILSARTISLPFLSKPTSLTLASSLFRRPLRLLIPLSIALAITTLISNLSSLPTKTLPHFQTLTNNTSLPTPYTLPSPLTYFNALYTFFWTVRNYDTQAASRAFYNNSLWPISVIYTQSYTVYLASVIIPYTRPKWRLSAWTAIILTAWWVQSWAWFSISGLFLADAVMHMQLQERLGEGVKLRLSSRRSRWELRVPGWVPGVVLLLAGGTLQFFWKEWRPTFEGGQSNVAQPLAREDDYLVVMGLLLLLESLRWLRKAVGNVLFVAIGRRSLSVYLVGSIILNTLGIALFMHLTQSRDLSSAAAIAVSVVVCLVFTALMTEAFYRLIEVPTASSSKRLFEWIRT